MTPPRLLLLCEGDSFETFHQATSASAAALAEGGRADLVLFYGALARWLGGEVDRLDAAASDRGYAEALESGRVARPSELLADLRREGARVFACSASLALLGHDPADLDDRVDEVVGWPTILRWIRESDATLQF
jgi:hypothetical protein